MPIFKQLAEVEKPADPDRYILIEVIHEPAIGKQYTVTGKGLDRELAKTVNVPIIYLSSGINRTET